MLGAALRREVGFRRYIGLDLSDENVRHLRRVFDDPRVEIVHSDAESVALENLGRQLRPGGRIVFDLIEGSREYFHRDQLTFMREYTRSEVSEIVRGASLELVTIDRVQHAPGRSRMLVVVAKL